MKGIIFASLILTLVINAQKLPNLQGSDDNYTSEITYFNPAGFNWYMLDNIQNLTLRASRAYDLSADSAFDVAQNLSYSLA
jgi:hypothetical protein